MARTISIGRQDFERIRTSDNFYIDKTDFIRQWWEADDDVTLITRPRRFGKTLNMSMVEQFFSVDFAGREDLFEGLSIWEEEKYRHLQGTYPVISLSFSRVKGKSYQDARQGICQILTEVFNRFHFLLADDRILDREKESFNKVSENMEDYTAANSLNLLSNLLMR